MYGFGATQLAGFDDLVSLQIAFRDRCRSDAESLVSHGNVLGPGVRIGIDRNGLDAELLGRCHHPAGNLAAVGNEDLLEHFSVLLPGSD